MPFPFPVYTTYLPDSPAPLGDNPLCMFADEIPVGPFVGGEILPDPALAILGLQDDEEILLVCHPHKQPRVGS